MSQAQRLVCLRPDALPQLAIQNMPLPLPGRGQVLVRVQATSVNPIDLKRSAGYGRRLLGLKGAARFPLVLGNDVAGVVVSVGPDVGRWHPGDRVYGLVPTGPQGAHASHVLADEAHLRRAPAHARAEDLAALPYTFTTLWLALHSLGLSPEQARGKRVLVHGASGGLGQLALQVLGRWGADIMAVCSTAHVQRCRDLGASQVWDRRQEPLSSLPRHFDASLNFATWADEATLVGCLRQGALGHATTVHPLLASFDERGWVSGAVHAGRSWLQMRKLVRGTGASARYAWVVFKPSSQALDALAHLLSGDGLDLPIGIACPLSQGHQAFAHVARQSAGRAILLPE
jgi:NADPH:quinone reductase-like Zn-dependent oxidoreductase